MVDGELESEPELSFQAQRPDKILNMGHICDQIWRRGNKRGKDNSEGKKWISLFAWRKQRRLMFQRFWGDLIKPNFYNHLVLYWVQVCFHIELLLGNLLLPNAPAYLAFSYRQAMKSERNSWTQNIPRGYKKDLHPVGFFTTALKLPLPKWSHC